MRRRHGWGTDLWGLKRVHVGVLDGAKLDSLGDQAVAAAKDKVVRDNNAGHVATVRILLPTGGNQEWGGEGVRWGGVGG